MTQEEKRLLLVDLSARLPYNVMVKRPDDGTPDYISAIDVETGELMVLYNGYTTDIEKFRPYLRPLSSMTEEEKEEMHNLLSPEGTAIYKNEGIAIPLNHCGDWVPYEFMNRIIEYLNAHNFDYRGLIEKGLAIDCTGLNVY